MFIFIICFFNFNRRVIFWPATPLSSLANQENKLRSPPQPPLPLVITDNDGTPFSAKDLGFIASFTSPSSSRARHHEYFHFIIHAAFFFVAKEEQESTPKRQPTNAQRSQLQIVEQSRVGSCHIKWFAH